MGWLDVLYEPVANKYFIDFVLAFITMFLNVISDDLEGWEYLYKASHIETGTYNWTIFTVYLTLFVPHYFGDMNKLRIFSFVIIVFWLLTVGCWIATTLGEEWRIHESLSEIALAGSPLVLAIISLAVFAFFDLFFWAISPYL